MVSIKPDDQFLIDPELALIFHLSGDYAMRRVEVMRAEVLDFDGPMVHVRGKGNVGQQGFYKLENLKKTTFLQGARIGTGSTCCVLDKFGCGVRGNILYRVRKYG